MTIRRYLDIIKLFCIPENIKKSGDAQLNDLVEKILLNSDKCYLNLTDFLREISQDCKRIIANEKAVNHSTKQIAKHLDLLFVTDSNTIENVCFANSNEMRPEFRQTFTLTDVLDYCYAILHSETFDTFLRNEVIRIPITSDSTIFWQLVRVGFELRYKMLEI